MQRLCFHYPSRRVGGGVALGAQAQQPVDACIGLLYAVSAEEWAERTAAIDKA